MMWDLDKCAQSSVTMQSEQLQHFANVDFSLTFIVVKCHHDMHQHITGYSYYVRAANAPKGAGCYSLDQPLTIMCL